MLRHDFEAANVRFFAEKLVMNLKLSISLRFGSKNIGFSSYVLYLQNV
jgi:hypothetical protein